MKSRHILGALTIGLVALMANAVNATTRIAELPLKASVLAKPNVIFGMDDSGSMDWEVLLDTESGLLYWDGVRSWDNARGKPLATSSFIPYAYLMPVGTSVGGALYPPNTSAGQSVPPTNQFAWLRSQRFNPIYYDSRATYRPWSPAYFAGSVKTYTDALPTAAMSHPAVSASPTLNLTTNWDSAHGSFSAAGFRFYVQQGMRLPAGARVVSSSAGSAGQPCSGSTEVTLTAAQTVPANRACWASIPYYPATFWHFETCTIGADCVAAPDGTGTLKRYEIKPSTTAYPSGRSYAEEMQNFANWFTYYRKRKLMLAASMGRVLESTAGLRLGVVPFNQSPNVVMYDADDAAPAGNRLAAAGHFYLNSMSALGTPTHNTVKHIAAQYDTNKSVIQYACQRNSMFIVTDGFSNTTSIAVPSYNAALWGGSPPYSWTPPGSLSDLALSYFTNRLRTDLPAGRVPPSASSAPGADKNTNLHINTYAITLGVRGSLWPNAVDPFVTAPTWTQPVADTPSMIDDQWHATINGRGRMYLATSPDETARNLKAGLDDILSQRSTQAAVSVSTVNLARGDSRAYQAVYNPAGWTGDVEAVSVNVTTGAVGTTPLWSAANLLTARDWTTRVIASHNGTSGVAFTASAVGAAVNPSGIHGSSNDVIAYLRGDRSRESSDMRPRQSLIGAIINAEPVVDREQGVVYAATGEGMLHAFETQGSDAGKELWAYVPQAALPGIGQTVRRGYTFRSQLDGTPTIRTINGSMRLLVAGMGVAGRSYYALNVTDPRSLTSDTALASRVLWEFPSASDATAKSKVGRTMGKPHVVRLGNGSWVVLLTSGYNSSFDGKGRLWVLNATTGAVLKEFVTTDGSLSSESGLTHVSPYAEPDGSVRYVYGGDLLGNLWRFDLNGTSLSSTAVSKVAQLIGPSGVPQPVTAPPELLAYQDKRIVYVGTGRLLDITDFGSSLVQTMYAISDGPTLTNARSTLVMQTLNTAGNGNLSSNSVDWNSDRGWYIDIPAGEQLTTRPSIAYGALTIVANKTGANDCSASSRLLVIDVLTGSRFAGANFVSWQISDTSNATAAVAVLTSDGQSIKAIAREFDQARSVERTIASGIPVLPRKNAWREVRR
jgi:type IV pilus assembly protein PilY1